MTTIAFDGRYMAADNLCTGTDLSAFFQKLLAYKDDNGVQYCIGGAGTAAHIPRFVGWYLMTHGADGDAFSSLAPLNGVILVARYDPLARKMSLCEISEDGIIYLPTPFGAIGSGGGYAAASMLTGGNAATAVSVASKLDTGTGSTLIVYDVIEGAWVKKPPKKASEATLAMVAPHVTDEIHTRLIKCTMPPKMTTPKPTKSSGN